VGLSALTGEGLERLRDLLMEHFSRWMAPVKLFLPPAQMRWLSRIYEAGQVTSRRDTPQGIYLEARLPATLTRQLDGVLKRPNT